MKTMTRTLIPALVLVLALSFSISASAQPGSWSVNTVIGPLNIPLASVVGAGKTCEEAEQNALDQLREDYLLLSVNYGQCLCSDVIDLFTGEVLTTLCSVKATAWVFRKATILTN